MSSETDAEPDPLTSAEDTRRYVVGECVGHGGLGSVYRAWDAHLGRWVAVKRLTADGDPEAAAGKLRREANALAALQHPHIVTVHDVGTDAEGPFVVMEFIEGETLDAIAGRAPLDLESFGTLAVQTLGAVEAAHRAGLLHRDLKPGNIMLAGLADGGFTVKVLDFGLAKFAPRPATQTLDHGDSLLGSIFFMAPEQFRRQPLDARTDLYALGAIFYYSLTGMHPFDGETTAQVMASHLEGRLLRPLARLRPDVPPALAAWVERLMSRVPTDRPTSAAAALAIARPFLAGSHLIPGGNRHLTGTAPVLLTPVDPAWRRWLWPAVGLAALLLAGGGFYAMRTGLFKTTPPAAPVIAATPAPVVVPAATPAPVVARATAAPSFSPSAPPAVTVTDPNSPVAAISPTLPSPATPTTAAASPVVATPAPAASALAPGAALDAADTAGLRGHLNEFVTVKGVPRGVGQSRTGTVFYLNFGSRPHEGLAVVCFGGTGAAISQEDFRPFVGRPVTVRGKLGDFKGDLQVVVDSPASIRAAP